MPECKFEVGVCTPCQGTREFNYLDYLFFWDSDTYQELCKLSDIENPTPSQLMKELEKRVGQSVKVSVDDAEFEGIFALTDDYRIVIKECSHA